MAKRGPKFTDLEREMVKERISDLHRKGYSQTDIAKEVGVAQSMVSVYVSQLKEEYRSRALRHRGEAINEKLEQYRTLRMEAYKAWVRSQQCSNPDIKLNGDAEFLKVVLAVHAKECALEGLDEQPENPGTKLQVNQVNSAPDLKQILTAAKEQLGVGDGKPVVIEHKEGLNGSHT